MTSSTLEHNLRTIDGENIFGEDEFDFLMRIRPFPLSCGKNIGFNGKYRYRS